MHEFNEQLFTGSTQVLRATTEGIVRLGGELPYRGWLGRVEELSSSLQPWHWFEEVMLQASVPPYEMA